MATALTLLASAARTTSGVGAAVDLGSSTTALLDLVVTAVSGTTPSLVVALQTSADSVVWQTATTVAAVSATGRTAVRVVGALRYLRVSYTISGTDPSFTFSVSGEAV